MCYSNGLPLWMGQLILMETELQIPTIHIHSMPTTMQITMALADI